MAVVSINPVHVEPVEFTPDSVHDSVHDLNAPLFKTLCSALTIHRNLALENLALRQQIAVLRRSIKRPRLKKTVGSFGCSCPRSGTSGPDVASQFPLGSTKNHGELLKLGIRIPQAAVSKYMVRHRKPPAPSWRAFLNNPVRDLVSIDFFTVPTVSFNVLFVFVVLAHDRRRVVHFNVTETPGAKWTAQQSELCAETASTT
jgi:hypothetical protein